MKIKNEIDSLEQITNKNLDSYVLNSIKKILQKDQFNLFKLKSKIDLNSRIELSNKEIDKLIQLKTKNQKKIQDLEVNVNKISQLNKEMINDIGYRLNEN